MLRDLLPILSASLIGLLCACSGGGTSGGDRPVTPRAVADSAITNENTQVTVDVLANDTSIDRGSLAIASEPGSGAASVTGAIITYTPDPGFSGNDSLTYSVTGTNGTSLTATLSITVNAAPTATADSFTVTQNTPTSLDVVANDADSDGSIADVLIVDGAQGDLSIDGTTVTYTPPSEFVGSDAFSYRVRDDDGATSDAVQVAIDVIPIPDTTLTVTSLTVPRSGYEQLNHPELSGSVLSSPLQTLTILPNTVSFSIMLRGDDVSAAPSDLLIANVTDPGGVQASPLFRHLVLCDRPLCSAYVPRRSGLVAERGDWHFRLGTRADDLSGIDFNLIQMDVATRVGRAPDLDAEFPATLSVRPFLTATSATVSDIDDVMAAFVALANDNGIAIDLDPVTVVGDTQFEEVSSNFTDPTTAQLVNMGDANKVNIFFVESFTGPSGQGRIGIAPGIPGTFGVKSNLNGVLINATVTLGSSNYAQSTAEFAFHETGHLLGLYHTTESDFGQHDILSDTPECTEQDDDNSDGQGGVFECPDGLNLMFWTIDFNHPKFPLTTQQRRVLYYSPIAVP